MYYIKISEDEDEDEKNTLIYYCRNCGHENKNITAENVCVSETQLRRSEKKYSQMVNEYTKYDPTLPRINTIKCPNHECISNNESQSGGGVQMGSVQMGSGRPTKAEAAAKAAAKAEAEASGIPLPTKKPRTTKLKPTAEQKEKIQKALGKQASAASASAASQVSAQQKEEEALAQIMEEQEQEEEELEAAAKTYLASAQKETMVGPIATENDHNNREIIYLRYDDINMKYIYLCVHCNTVWKTDNRQ